MNCENLKELMVVHILGKLTPEEKNNVEIHIKKCSKCALVFDKFKTGNTITGKKKPSRPDWQKSWEVIAAKSIKKKHILENSYQKYAMAAAVLIVVFVTGFIVGKKYLISGTEPQLTITDKNYEISINSFTEDLEPILIDILNRSDQKIPPQFVELEKNIVAGMLTKTKLLRYLVSKRDNTHLVQLLEDIEFILLSLSNLRSEDYLSMKQIQQFIREKKIKYQLRLFAENKLTI